jgi:hypothetical protein
MYAMQYEIGLPADYDMSIIRRRVATKGPLLDAFPGLGLKAYLIRERGVAGSPINQYAPFYLWASTDGMSRFLWGGGGFGAIVSSFGRPTVRHWTGVACALGPESASRPTRATRSIVPIGDHIDPAAAVEAARDEMQRLASLQGVHSSALAVDPQSWSLVHFTLWAELPPDADGARYEVLHLSTPHLEEIAATR